jgi:hypothetical protein
MSDAKKRKKMRKYLLTLSRAQLVALGKQKTDVPYQTLLSMDVETLADTLIVVDGVLKPEAAE